MVPGRRSGCLSRQPDCWNGVKPAEIPRKQSLDRWEGVLCQEGFQLLQYKVHFEGQISGKQKMDHLGAKKSGKNHGVWPHISENRAKKPESVYQLHWATMDGHFEAGICPENCCGRIRKGAAHCGCLRILYWSFGCPESGFRVIRRRRWVNWFF